MEEKPDLHVIPGRRTRKVIIQYDRDIYKERHLIESFFKQGEKLPSSYDSRYDKLACDFKVFPTIGIRYGLTCLSFKTRAKKEHRSQSA